MQATTHTERRYWHLAKRRHQGQPLARQTDRTNRLVWSPVVAIDLDGLMDSEAMR